MTTIPGSTRLTIPPIMSVLVEDAMDVMIARSSARRVAGLLGFASPFRAQIATAVAVLADIIVNSELPQTIHLNGLRDGAQTAIQISCAAPWLAAADPKDALVALLSKLEGLVDEVALEPGAPPKIVMMLWLLGDRTTSGSALA